MAGIPNNIVSILAVDNAGATTVIDVASFISSVQSTTTTASVPSFTQPSTQRVVPNTVTTVVENTTTNLSITADSNYIPKVNPTQDDLINSLIYDKGNRIGINTNSPQYLLDIYNGSVNISPSLTNDGYKISSLNIAYADRSISTKEAIVMGDDSFLPRVSMHTLLLRGLIPSSPLGSTRILGIDDYGVAKIAIEGVDYEGAIGYTPANAATTLTINGTTYDLSANRTWTVGTVSSATSPLSIASNVISISQANATTNGYVSSTDWNYFSAKQSALSGTGFVKIAGTTITYDNSVYTPTSRTLTINGTAYDLSADRSWTISTGSGMRNVSSFVATSGQTTFTITGGYTAGLVDVYVNGTRLSSADFTATSGTTVVLATGLVANDIVDIINYVAGLTSGTTGTGTTNYIPKWSSSSNLTNSLFFDDGTKIGLNTITPDTIFQVYYNSTGTTFNDIAHIGSGAGKSLFIGTNGYGFSLNDSASRGGWGIDSDSDSGFMRFYYGTSEKVRINVGGQLLIGTTTVNSSEKLSIIGSATYNGVVRIENNVNQLDVNHGTLYLVNTVSYAIGNDASVMFGAKNSGGVIHPRASIGAKTASELGADLVFNTRNDSSYAERMRITSSGNVGIGTTSPTQKLDVNGAIKTLGDYYAVNNTPFSTNGTITYHDTVGLTLRGATGYVYDFAIYNTSATALLVNPTGTTTMSFPSGNVIITGGNAAIGTATPSNGYGGTISNVKLALRNGTPGSTGGTSVLLIGGDNDHYASITGSHTGGGNTYMAFATSTGAVNPTEKMRILSNGQVGIGVTNPFNRFQVDGGLSSGGGVTFANDNTWTTVWTFTNTDTTSGSFQFFVGGTNSSLICFFTKNWNGGSSQLVVGNTLASNALCSVQVSGDNIQVKQTYGVGLYIYWSLQKIF